MRAIASLMIGMVIVAAGGSGPASAEPGRGVGRWAGTYGASFDDTPQTTMRPLTETSAVARRSHALVRLTSVDVIPPLIRERAAAVCRVTVPDGRGSSVGSGIYIGDRLVLTANHVIRDGNTAATTVDFGDGPIRGVAFLGNKYADQAVIELERAPEVAPVPIASQPLQIGQTVYGVGHGGLQFGAWQGRIAEYSSTHPGRMNNVEYPGQTGGAISGDSGGATLNEAGELCGNIWGGRGAATHTVTVEETRQFLSRNGLLGRVLGCRSGGGCPGGVCTYGPAPVAPSMGTPAQGETLPAPSRYSPPGTQTVTYPDTAYAPPAASPPTAAATGIPPATVSPGGRTLAVSLDELVELLAADARFRGNDGRDGSDGQSRGPSADELDAIAGKVVRRLQADPGFLASIRGPAGADGRDGDDGQDGPAGKPGPAGPPGRDAEVDLEELSRRVAAKIGANLVVRVDSVTGDVEVAE